MIAWPLAALREVPGDVVVVAKAGSPLPPLDVPVLVEPDEPRHPAAGIRRALAEGRPVLACAADLPLVTPEAVARVGAAGDLARAEAALRRRG